MQNDFKTILSILKFCARIDTRKYAHARVIWPEIDRTDIDLYHDEYEWEIAFGYEDMIMSWFYKMAPRWGHQWTSMSKTLLCFCTYALYICVPNFKAFDWAIFKLSCPQKSG